METLQFSDCDSFLVVFFSSKSETALKLLPPLRLALYCSAHSPLVTSQRELIVLSLVSSFSLNVWNPKEQFFGLEAGNRGINFFPF